MRRTLLITLLATLSPSVCLADDVLYRYEGEVLPYDPLAGWLVFNPCEPPCTESLDGGHFVLQWPEAGDLANYTYIIAEPSEEPPPSLWVEWQFRSNHPIPPHSYTCDAVFVVHFGEMFDVIFMYGDAVISFSGSEYVGGLPNGEFRTYRFESPDGMAYWFSVDGQVFRASSGTGGNGLHYLQMAGRGGCLDDQIPDMVNEWDFVRFGTVASEERMVASEPPAGYVDARRYAPLDRFTVTFDAPNYVYLDEIAVEALTGDTPEVISTRRLRDGAPETVEFVLDRPIPMGTTTRFTFDDGDSVKSLEYTFAWGDTDGDGDADLYDAAAFQSCFGQSEPLRQCLVLDADTNGTIDLNDYALWYDVVASNP